MAQFKEDKVSVAQDKVPVQKIILCGEYGSGKSSIFRRFATNTYVTENDRGSTLGLDNITKEFVVNDKIIRLQLWDTGGMERSIATSSYYKFAEAAILVFSLDNLSSLHAMSQHFLDIVTHVENARIFICGNKSDMGRQVSDVDIENFCRQRYTTKISGIFRTSCRTNSGVQEMFQYIAETLNNPNKSKNNLQNLEQHGFHLETLNKLPEEEKEY